MEAINQQWQNTVLFIKNIYYVHSTHSHSSLTIILSTTRGVILLTLKNDASFLNYIQVNRTQHDAIMVMVMVHGKKQTLTAAVGHSNNIYIFFMKLCANLIQTPVLRPPGKYLALVIIFYQSKTTQHTPFLIV